MTVCSPPSRLCLQGIDDMEASVFGDLGRKMSTSSRKNSHSSLSEKVQKVSMSV